MKHLPILLLFVFFSISVIAQNSVTITGKIENPTDYTVSIMVLDELVNDNEIFKGVSEIQADGTFHMKVDWDKSGPAFFCHNFRRDYKNTAKAIYLFPGDSLYITLDVNEFDESINFSGKGADVNNYLARKALLEENEKKELLKVNGRSPKGYTSYIDSFKDIKLGLLYRHLSKVNGSNEQVFLEWEKQDIIYDWAWNKLRYPRFNKKITKKEPSLPPNYYTFLSKVKISNDKMLNSTSYRWFIGAYMNYNYKKALEKNPSLRNNIVEWQFNFIGKELQGETRNWFWCHLIGSNINEFQNLDRYVPLLSKFDSVVGKDNQYYKIVNHVFEKSTQLQPGNPAPVFAYMDIHGKQISLSQFKGKVVFITIWSSWANVFWGKNDWVEALMMEFKDEDVIFMNISVDIDEGTWRKNVEKDEIGGVNLISAQNSDNSIITLYNVSILPTYYVINKKGDIIHRSQSYSTGLNTKEKISQALNQ